MLTPAVLADATADLTPAWFTAALREGGVLGSEAALEKVEAGLYGTSQPARSRAPTSATPDLRPAHSTKEKSS